MTKEETDQKNMANLRAYLNGLGMPKEDRDALPYGTTRTDLLSYAKGYEDAKREAREVAEAGGWISVDDRLPPINCDIHKDASESIVVWNGSEVIDSVRYIEVIGQFMTDAHGKYGHTIKNVISWQPLPSRPKTTGPSADLPTASPYN
jgi:hypothetical protein